MPKYAQTESNAAACFVIAALDMKTWKVRGKCAARDTREEFVDSLGESGNMTPKNGCNVPNMLYWHPTSAKAQVC